MSETRRRSSWIHALLLAITLDCYSRPGVLAATTALATTALAAAAALAALGLGCMHSTIHADGDHHFPSIQRMASALDDQANRRR